MSNDRFLSKGIDSEIDLTENTVFRNGAVNPFYENLNHGSVPWNSDGELLKSAPRHLKNESSFNNTWNFFDDLNTSYSLSSYEYKFSYNWETTNNLNQDNIDICKLKLEYIENLKTASTEKDFIINVIKLLQIGTNLHINNKNELCISDKNTKTNTYLVNFYDWSNSDNDHSSLSSFKYDNIKNCSKINSSDITIYPSFLPIISISKEELNGNKIITGKQIDIFNKLKVIKFRKKILELINKNIPRKNIIKKCLKCGHQWIPIYGDNKINDDCPYCKLRELLSMHNNSNKLYTMNKYRWIDMHLNIDIIREDCRDFYMYSYWSYDYFNHPRYSDRGVHLLRLRRGDHELQINYDKEYDRYDDLNENRDFITHNLKYAHDYHNILDWF